MTLWDDVNAFILALDTLPYILWTLDYSIFIITLSPRKSVNNEDILELKVSNKNCCVGFNTNVSGGFNTLLYND